MPNIELAIADSRYSTNVTGAWKGTSEPQIWSGDPSNNAYHYFSRIELATGDLVIDHSTKLVLRLRLTQGSYLGGCIGVLSEALLNATDVCNSSYTGMSDELSAASIATSKACNEDGTEYPYDNTTYASGNYFYLIFDTRAIKANTTYYVYLIPTATSKSWVSSERAGVTAMLSYVSDHYVRIGVNMEKHIPYVRFNGNFVKYKPYQRRGGVWHLCN